MNLRFTPNLEALDQRLNPSASPQPVLMVIANQDFYYREATPSPGVGVLRSIDAGKTFEPQQDSSAVVFVGGWGSSMYQYA